jgi:hypothetical protein
MRIRPEVLTLPMRLKEETDESIVAPIQVARGGSCNHSETVCEECIDQWLNDYDLLDADEVIVGESG